MSCKRLTHGTASPKPNRAPVWSKGVGTIFAVAAAEDGELPLMLALSTDFPISGEAGRLAPWE